MIRRAVRCHQSTILLWYRKKSETSTKFQTVSFKLRGASADRLEQLSIRLVKMLHGLRRTLAD